MPRPSLMDAFTGGKARKAGSPAGRTGNAETRRTVPIDLEQIAIGERLRLALDEEKVGELARSMQDAGLQTPILVHPWRDADADDPDAWGKDNPGLYRLVAGAHRLEAARRLGWTDIETLILPRTLTPAEVRLIEVEENLVRAGLTALERGRFHAAHKALYEKLHPGTGRGGDHQSVDYEEKKQTENVTVCSFAAAAAERTGKSERAIRRAVMIGEAFPDGDARVLAATPLADREGDLYRLAAMPARERRKALDAIAGAAEPPSSLSQALRAEPRTDGGGKPDHARLEALKRAWTDTGVLDAAWLPAPRQVRTEFVKWLRAKARVNPSSGRG